MIKAYRIANHVVLEAESSSGFERALLDIAGFHLINLKRVPSAADGLSRYRLSKPDEGRRDGDARRAYMWNSGALRRIRSTGRTDSPMHSYALIVRYSPLAGMRSAEAATAKSLAA